MDNSLNEMLDIFGKDDLISNPSQNKISPLKDSLTIREDSIAYYCEKCRISTFYSSKKKCGVCGYNFGHTTR